MTLEYSPYNILVDQNAGTPVTRLWLVSDTAEAIKRERKKEKKGQKSREISAAPNAR